jgi:putative ABC transport system substrate-binding protein
MAGEVHYHGLAHSG